jgi:hypothetical protein
MRKTFTRALIINALLQFIVTRQRAGTVAEEGAAEMLWLRYPLVVLMNAVLWTVTLTTFGRIASFIRGAR